MRKTITGGFLAAVLLLGSPAWGCPYCESDVGKEVAAGIFNEDFAVNAVLTLLPVPILLAIVYLVHFGFAWPKSGSPEEISVTSPQSAKDRSNNREPRIIAISDLIYPLLQVSR